MTSSTAQQLEDYLAEAPIPIDDQQDKLPKDPEKEVNEEEEVINNPSGFGWSGNKLLFSPNSVNNDLFISLQEGKEEEEEKERETPLTYWRKKRERFPDLAKVARRYLSAPPTSTDSERLFSAAANVLNHKRNRLSCHKAEMLLFVKKNFPHSCKKTVGCSSFVHVSCEKR